MKNIFKEAIFQTITEIDFDNATDEDILRIAISAEESAINLYNRLSRATENNLLKKVLLDIAKEEKVHTGEFQTVLFEIDREEMTSHEDAYEEIKNLMYEKKIKEENNVINIQEEVVINQEDQNIILEPGDKIKVLEAEKSEDKIE